MVIFGEFIYSNLRIANLIAIFATLRRILSHRFNRGREFGAFVRFVHWQVGSRLAMGPVIVNFVDNTKLAISAGMRGATGNVYTGLHEFDDMAFALHLLRPGELFVDIGANVGSYTVLAAATGARVIAFEPAADAFRTLALNIRINDLSSRVTAKMVAVGRSHGLVRITRGCDTVNHVIADREVSGGDEISVTTLDDELSETPTLIKIDIEGYETEAVAGASRTFTDPSLLAVIMELNGSGIRYGFDEESLHKKMLGYGFQSFTYDGFTRTLTPLSGKNHRKGNTIYLRHIEIVEARAISAPHYKIQDWRV